MKRILVVEDEAKIARLVRDYLEHAGFQVAVAGDGERQLRQPLHPPRPQPPAPPLARPQRALPRLGAGALAPRGPLLPGLAQDSRSRRS